MTAAEARQYISVMHLCYIMPKIDFIQTKSGGTVALAAATDEDVIWFASELQKTEIENYQLHKERVSIQ